MAASDELLAEGEDGLHGVATPAQLPLGTASSTRKTSPGRSSVWGPALLGWTQGIFERDLFAADARIFGLTSEGNTLAWKGYAAVSAAKVSLEALVRSIAVEFGPYGIRCNVIQAGVTETPALRAIPGSEQLVAQARLRNPGRSVSPSRETSRT